ncbi:MAG TPA: FemAB family XrtA/PEP-CTERM system-associated protein [Burkholderiales bacterium]|nr:FemAB family XrtA/PEP-CTERM system-associated protein [Burkholderiales bacterium]
MKAGDAIVGAAGLRVRGFEAKDTARWDAFVECCPSASFFHRSPWRSILEDVLGHRTHYLIAERDDAVVGILPLAEIRSLLFGHSLVSLPFCVYGGAAVVEDAALRALHDHAKELGQRLGVSHLELRDREQRESTWPQQDLYVTFRKEILPDVEANMLAIPRKQRAMVRKGIKNGLLSHVDANVDRFFALYAGNVHRHGTPPLSKKYFRALQRSFGADCEVLTVTDAQGRPLSSVLSFYFRDEVLPYYAGDDERARDLAANDFKYWELMRRACERGCRLFDYGRSKRGTGSFDFKKNWGFEPTPLAYEYCLYKGDQVPQNNPLNPKYRAFIALWQRLPLPIVNAIGPHLVRHLG